MSYELLPSTGIRKSGTRATELRSIFESGITANSIQEQLKFYLYGDCALTVADELTKLDFDIAGAKASETASIDAYLRRDTLGAGECSAYVTKIVITDVICESTPLIRVLEVLKCRNYVFVLSKDSISGIITRADLQKPPVRILIFGLVSLLEMHLSYLVKCYFPDDSWRELLSQGRLEKAEQLLQERISRNEEIDLLSCLQLVDKKTLLLANKEILVRLGFSDKGKCKSLLTDFENLRNKLAHSQDIVNGTTWEKVIETVSEIESMIVRLDMILEEQCNMNVEA